MTTVRAWLFISKIWNMLGQLSSWHDNGQSMTFTLRYETCSVSCHRLMTTVRAWLFISKVWNMLRQLSSYNDNGQSMVIHPEGMKHALTVDIVSWQRWEHGYSSLRYETCSDSCHRDMTTSEHGYSTLRYETCSDSWHRLMTTVRAWLFISKVLNMLRQLSSWHGNGQSMVIHL